MNKKLIKRGIKRLWLVQATITLCFIVVCALKIGMNGAVSVFLAGTVYIVPNIIFVRTLFKYEGARSARKIVQGFYKGEALKIVLSIVMFTAIFLVYRVHALVFFVTYIALLQTQWLVPWIFTNKQNRPESD